MLFLLEDDAPDEVRGAAAGAIGALSAEPAVGAALAGETRAPALLARMLRDAPADAEPSSEQRRLHQLRVAAPAARALRVLAGARGAHDALATLGDGPVLALLLDLLSADDAELQESAAALVGSVALAPAGAASLAQTDAVARLVPLLSARDEGVQLAATRALKNLAARAGVADGVAQAGGMAPLVKMLRSRSAPLTEAAAAALELLTMDAERRAEFAATIPPESVPAT